MKRIFLTSGLIVCMACPAVADVLQNQTIDPSGDAATCQYPTLEGYSGTSTFTAKWTPNTYTITYNKGTLSCNQEVSGNSPTSQTFTYDVPTTLTANGYSATGYTFGAWSSSTDITAVDGINGGNNTASGGVFYYPDEHPVSYKYVGNDAVLTAIWRPVASGDITLNASKYNSAGTAVEYSVTNLYPIRSVYGDRMIEGLCTGFLDGSGNEIPGGCEIDDETITSITPPTLAGYDFEGFYTAVNGGGTKVINANGTFIDCVSTRQISTAGATATWYAKWTPNVYTITLRDYNDQTTHSTIYEKYATGWYSDSAATTAIANNTITPPTRSGYTFRGFYTAQQSDLTATGGSGTQRITNTGVLPANTTFSENTNLYAAWAQNCNAGTGCNCSLTINNDGTATYTTSAQTGYTLTSGSGTYAPVCTPDSHTITYSCGTKPGSESQTGTVPTPGTATYNATFNIAATSCPLFPFLKIEMSSLQISG